MYKCTNSFALVFCPVDCDLDWEKFCPGEWNNITGLQMTADTCIPLRNGDCMNYCPVTCGENEKKCPGNMDSTGCKMPDTCHSGSKFLLICTDFYLY